MTPENPQSWKRVDSEAHLQITAGTGLPSHA